MKQKPQVRVFKNELRNYNFYISEIKRLTEVIDNCYYELSGVKANDPSKEPVHSLPNKEREYRLRRNISHFESRRKLVQTKIDYIDQVLSNIQEPLVGTIKKLFVEGSSLSLLCNDYNLSTIGLYKKINKAIEKALNE